MIFEITNRLIRYLKYLNRARHYKKYAIHSPFIYELGNEALFVKDSDSDYKFIEEYKKELLANNLVLNYHDPGAGSKNALTKSKKVKHIATTSSTHRKYGKLLSRLVGYFSPNIVLEIGTSLGISSLYVSKSLKKHAQFYTIEGVEEIHKIAETRLNSLGNNKIHLLNGLFDDILPRLLDSFPTLDFVFFDGNHTKEATLRYFGMCLQKINNNSIFVFDDIHWSDDMEEAWECIKGDEKTKVCIDIFQFGIVFFRKDLPKQDYTILF